ncbi:hypothetical protein MMPV_002375 [Pyropia vietnamensis]
MAGPDEDAAGEPTEESSTTNTRASFIEGGSTPDSSLVVLLLLEADAEMMLITAHGALVCPSVGQIPTLSLFATEHSLAAVGRGRLHCIYVEIAMAQADAVPDVDSNQWGVVNRDV